MISNALRRAAFVACVLSVLLQAAAHSAAQGVIDRPRAAGEAAAPAGDLSDDEEVRGGSPTITTIGGETFVVASDGVALRFVDVGEGEPLVLLHGLAASLDVWRMTGLLEALAEDHRVLALDVRGHGKSDKPHEAARYGVALVDDVVALLDALGIAKAHVVGYSMGGMITLALVEKHPERIASAVAGGFGLYDFGAPGEGLLDRVADSLDAGEGFGPLYDGLRPEGAEPMAPERTAALDRMSLAVNDAPALAAACRSFRALALDPAKLARNKVPVLAFVGEMDGLYPDVEALADTMTRLEVEVVKGADHMGAGMSPRFVPTVRGFLAAHPITQEPAEPEPRREPAGAR